MSQLNKKINKRALGEPVTGPVLQAKAKQFHASLNVDSNFSANNAPAHPSSTELNEIDPQFFVVYLPNVTSLKGG
ncbi:hypothetical protein NQ318_005806 [Aromia moschata]|uniref:HTH CENPB-type domain-containing protein n=1 Tax=Aromia moschata TaxID=1265417 RepID=A0AAV8YU31_9CUCU|nr:hypothetical protein NQ318_005806 [Aromia moschata]